MQPLNAGILFSTLGGVFPKSCYLRRFWDRLSIPESAEFTLPRGTRGGKAENLSGASSDRLRRLPFPNRRLAGMSSGVSPRLRGGDESPFQPQIHLINGSIEYLGKVSQKMKTD